MRAIGVVTVARSDFGIYQAVLEAIRADSTLQLLLYVGGMHLMPAFGHTVDAIEAAGFRIVERVDTGLVGDSPAEVSRAIGAGVSGFAAAFARSRPDLLLVLGDRFDMFAAPVAALPMNIPVGHIHGGEITRGAMDDSLRHAMTKLSHLHFVSTEEHGRRVLQMGEEPWRVTVSGAPALDRVGRMALLSRAELEQRFGLDLSRQPLLVTYHPVTLEHEQAETQTTAMLEALRATGLPMVFTLPNADTGNSHVQAAIRRFLGSYRPAWMVDNLGSQAYFSLMSMAAAMVGNSSSGIIEAPSFALPVVNIGTRQDGRMHARNVLDVGYAPSQIAAGLDVALSPAFRAGLQGLVNPYGDGHAAERIVAVLKSVRIDDGLLRKGFVDMNPT